MKTKDKEVEEKRLRTKEVAYVSGLFKISLLLVRLFSSYIGFLKFGLNDRKRRQKVLKLSALLA